MYVDEAHNHLIFVQGSGRPVVVTDLAGGNPQTITALTGAGDLALSDDGQSLWVAMGDEHLLGRLFLADLTTTTYSPGLEAPGAAACPDDVFTSSGLVWFAHSCDHQWHHLRAMNPADGTLYDPANSQTLYSGYFFTTPDQPNRMYYTNQESQVAIHTTGLPTPDYTVDASLIYQLVSMTFAYDPVNQRVVTTDGKGLLPTDIGDQTSWFKYRTKGWPAVRHDGVIAFVNTTTTILQPGGQEVMRKVAMPSGTVAAEFGDERLYVVSSGSVSGYYLTTFIPRPAPTLTLTQLPTTKYKCGQKIHLGGLLGAGPSDRSLTLWRTTVDKVRTQVGTTVADESGTYAFDVKATEKASYEVLSAASDGYDSASVTTPQVTVEAKGAEAAEKAVGRQGRYHLWPVKKTAIVRATVSPNHAGDCVIFWAQFHARGHWGYDEYSSCVKLNDASNAWVLMKGTTKMLKIPFRFRFTFNSDDRNGGTRSPWLYGRFVKRAAKAGLEPTTARSAAATQGSAFTLAPPR